MKKYLVLLLVLVIACCAGVGYVTAELIDNSDEVTIKEIVRYGDPSAAQGIDISTRVTVRHQLFWESSHTVGREDELETTFRFTAERDYETPGLRYSGVFMGTDVDFVWDMTGSGPLYEAYTKLLNETAPGQESERIIKLSDYYDYYPIYLSVSVPGLSFDWNVWNNEHTSGNEPDMFCNAYTAFSEFFRIPILEEDYRSIHVEKSLDGTMTHWGSGWAADENDVWDTYSMYTQAAVLEDAVYFTVNNRSQASGEIVDFSLVPGGYGIYMLPYESTYANVQHIDEGVTKYEPVGASLKLSQLAMVYPLREEQEVIFLETNENGDLLLFTDSNGLLELTVIDPNGMETLQVVEVFFGDEEDNMYMLYLEDDFVALELSWSRIALLSMDEAGRYTLEFIVDTNPGGQELYYLDYEAHMDWNGEKLAVAYFKTPGSTEDRYVPDYYLAVYDKSGMLCFIEYDSSLSAMYESISSGRSDSVYCMDIDPIVVQWR